MRVTPEERAVIVAWEKKVILLSGVSGAGKTHTRKSDSALAGLPRLGIADVYREYLELDWQRVFWAFVKALRKMKPVSRSTGSRKSSASG